MKMYCRDVGLMGGLGTVYRENGNGGFLELLGQSAMRVYIRKFYPL